MTLSNRGSRPVTGPSMRASRPVDTIMDGVFSHGTGVFTFG